MPPGSFPWPIPRAATIFTGTTRTRAAYCRSRGFTYRAACAKPSAKCLSTSAQTARSRMSSTPVRRPRPTVPKHGSTMPSATCSSSSTKWVMPIVWRHGRGIGWSAGCTGCRWAGRFLARACFHAVPMPAKSRWCTSWPVYGRAAIPCWIRSLSPTICASSGRWSCRARSIASNCNRRWAWMRCLSPHRRKTGWPGNGWRIYRPQAARWIIRCRRPHRCPRHFQRFRTRRRHPFWRLQVTGRRPRHARPHPGGMHRTRPRLPRRRA